MTPNDRKIAEAMAHRQRQQRSPVDTHKITVEMYCSRCDRTYRFEQPWSSQMPMPIAVPQFVCEEDTSIHLELRSITRELLSQISVPVLVPPAGALGRTS